MEIQPQTGRKLPTKRVAQRFDRCTKTIERWAADPDLKFPKPLVINGYKYWDEADLENWERAQAAQPAAA